MGLTLWKLVFISASCSYEALPWYAYRETLEEGQWVDAFYSICFMSPSIAITWLLHLGSSNLAVCPQSQSQLHHYFSKIRAEGWANLISPSSHLLNFNNTNLFLLFPQPYGWKQLPAITISVMFPLFAFLVLQHLFNCSLY